MRIHPNLQPGTSQRLAKPPQDRMGTSLLRDAMDGQLQPGKTCRQHHISPPQYELVHGMTLSYQEGTRKNVETTFIIINYFFQLQDTFYCCSSWPLRNTPKPNSSPQSSPCPQRIDYKHMEPKSAESLWCVSGGGVWGDAPNNPSCKCSHTSFFYVRVFPLEPHYFHMFLSSYALIGLKRNEQSECLKVLLVTLLLLAQCLQVVNRPSVR